MAAGFIEPGMSIKARRRGASMKLRSIFKGPAFLSTMAAAMVVAGCSGTPSRREPSSASKSARKRSDVGAEKTAGTRSGKSAKTRRSDRGTRPAGPPDDAEALPGAGTGGKGLEDLARIGSLKDQERKALAEHYYKTGKGLFDQLRYRDAAANLSVAVQADKENLEARKLYEKTLWILGDRRGETFDMARELADTRIVAIKQAQIEVERLFREGELLVSKEKFNSAIERFERVLEAVRWFPYNIERDNLKTRSQDSIKAARISRDKQIRRFRQLKQQAAIEAAKAEKAQSLRYVNARLKALYRRALEAFRNERYVKVEDICDEIIESRPTDLQASRLRTAAVALRHRKREKDIFYDKVEHLRRQIEWIDESAVPYQSIFRFPGKAEWLEIAKRDIAIKDFLKKEEDTESIKINRRLASQRVDLNFDSTPFTDCINFLRDITGLNFVIANDANDIVGGESLEVSLRLKSIGLKNALQLILSVNPDLVYTIRDGVIVITTKEGNKAELFLEFYEVSDIINKVPDYPAPELGLKQSSGGAGGGGGAAGGVLNFDNEKSDDNSGSGVNAEKLLELVEKVGGESEDGSAELSGGILIIRKPASVHKKIIQLLEALRKTVGIMVTVESRFVEVQDNFLEQIGVDLTGLPQNIFGPRGTASAAAAAGVNYIDAQGQVNLRANMINLLSNAVGNGAGNPFNLVSSGGGAFQYNVLTDQFQLQAILEAVKKKQRARMVSSPRVTVFNGQRAHLLSINQRAYIQDVEVNQTGVIPVLNPVIGVLNTGSILDVRPTVSYDRKYVMLEVRPTLAQQTGTRNSIVTLAGGNTSIPIELPTIVVQKIRTSVTVPDGGTVLIGGMKDLQSQYNETRVPILGSIPIIKNFFRRQGSAALKRSGIVLLKAKITILREMEKEQFGTSQ
jgi:type II secretory pathway component GspD/PulD (secretin)